MLGLTKLPTTLIGVQSTGMTFTLTLLFRLPKELNSKDFSLLNSFKGEVLFNDYVNTELRLDDIDPNLFVKHLNYCDPSNNLVSIKFTGSVDLVAVANYNKYVPVLPSRLYNVIKEAYGLKVEVPNIILKDFIYYVDSNKNRRYYYKFSLNTKKCTRISFIAFESLKMSLSIKVKKEGKFYDVI